MDRNSVVWPGEDRLAEAVSNLPAPSSSASPNHDASLTQVERSALEAAPDALTSSNLESMDTCEGYGSHVAYGNHGSFEKVSTLEEGFLMLPFHAGDVDHSHCFGEAHGNAWQPSPGGDRTVSLSSLTVPFDRDLSPNYVSPPDTRRHDVQFLLDMTADKRSGESFPIGSGGLNGITQPAFANHSAQQLAARYHGCTESNTLQPLMDPHGHEVQTPSASWEVRGLRANALSATSLSPTYLNLEAVESASTKRSTPVSEWPQSTSPALPTSSDSSGFQNFDVSLRDGPSPFSSLPCDPGYNSMWEPSQHYSFPSLGFDSRDFYLNEFGGYDSLATSGTTSSLGSSRKLGGSILTSSDAWLSRSGEELVQGGQNVTFSRRNGVEASETTGNGRQYSLSSESSSGQRHCSGVGREEAVPSGSFAMLDPTKDAAGTSLAGGRMEEGCIGSKRRVWYRATNGQFASATQALSGEYPGDDHVTNGEGSSRNSGGVRRIRRRRKSEEVERKYRCDYDGCEKAYGTLNHLNTHRATNEHGQRLNAVGYRRAFAEWERRQLAVHRI